MLPSYASITTVVGLALILFGLLIFLFFLSKAWNMLLKRRVQKALRARRNHHDEFRSINGYSWDIVLVFNVYEEYETTTAEQGVYNMKTILAQLAKGGIETRCFYGLLRKTVYCKLRIPLPRLLKELDRINYLLAAEPTPLKQLIEAGRPGYWKGITIPEKSFETKLNPYHFIYFQYHFVDPETLKKELLDNNGKQTDQMKWRESVEKLYKTYPMYSQPETIATLGANIQHNQSQQSSQQQQQQRSSQQPIEQLNQSFDIEQLNQHDVSILRGIDRLKVLRAIISSNEIGGCNLDLEFLLSKKCILGFFPLHDIVELKLLEQHWFKIFDFPWNTKVDEIKNYFGEQIGLYFQWLSFYTSWLFVAGLIGFFAWIGVAVENNNPNAPDIPYFAGFISLWTTLFLEFWKRKEKYIAMEWGMIGFEETESARPSFYGSASISPVTGKPVIHFSKYERSLKSAKSFMLILGCLLVIFICLVIIFAIRTTVVKFNLNDGVIFSSIIFALQIIILAVLFDEFAVKLNDSENHRTETEYEDSLVIKSFLFNFINSYSCLFYIAFFKPFFPKLDPCVGSCMDELSMTLAVILFTRLAIGNFLEIFHPIILEWLTKRNVNNVYHSNIPKQSIFHINLFNNNNSNSNDDGREQLIGSNNTNNQQTNIEMTMSEVENNYFLPSYNRLSVFADYSEMVIQFGYATMFVSAFPLSTTMCFICNYVELRIDSWKLCQLYRRPEPRSAEDIGTWYSMMDFISYLAVLTNSGLVAFTGTYTMQYTWSSRIIIFLCMSAGLIAIKLLLAYVIPDVPREVELQLERQAFFNRKIEENVDDVVSKMKAPRLVPRYLVSKGDDDPL